MNRWQHLDINRDPYGNPIGPNPWQNPKSYAPNLYDGLAIQEHYERITRQLRWRNRLRRIIDGDGFFLVCGAVVAADLCLVIGLWTGAL
jgi:hypothetical protein